MDTCLLFSAKCIKIYNKGSFGFVSFYKTGRHYKIGLRSEYYDFKPDSSDNH